MTYTRGDIPGCLVPTLSNQAKSSHFLKKKSSKKMFCNINQNLFKVLINNKIIKGIKLFSNSLEQQFKTWSMTALRLKIQMCLKMKKKN